VRIVGVLLVALLAGVAPAEAKPLRYAAKGAVAKAPKRCAAKPGRCARAWVAAPRAPAPALPGAAAADPAPPADAPPPDVVPGAGGPTPVAAPKPPACDPSPWLGVIAEDVDGFRLRLTRTCVPAGTVLFNFRNNDLSDHNLWAESPGGSKRQVIGATPGETVVTGSASLTAGRWRLFCSLPGHEAMSRPVDVTPAG
jgi:hypothetical protein